MTIKVLPEEVASQIAAGEVVERPVSVVKELVENSLDSGASEIEIIIQEAGKRLIEVLDNGSGIPVDELEIAVARHSTSKLSQAADLFRIQTLGFRGEALASISSVSHFRIISRHTSADIGAELLVDGGIVQDFRQTAGVVGTRVVVENLFYNVPARLKFLKTDRTEKRLIDEMITRYALAYPGVRFKFTADQKPVIQTTGSGDRRDVVLSIYGSSIARQMIAVNHDQGDKRLTGFISPISLTRSNSKEITIFVNGRWIHDPGISKAVFQAYHTMIMVGRYPMAMLFLDMPADQVDINVHPTKSEVRFEDHGEIFRWVQGAVRRVLMAASPLPALEQSQIDWTERYQIPGGKRGNSGDFNRSFISPGAISQPVNEAKEDDPAMIKVPLLRLIGQIGKAYLVAEGPDGLYLIDQHAAHERILFEEMLCKDGQKPAQQLLEPVSMHLTPEESSRLAENLEQVNTLGYLIEPFGKDTFLIRSIPSILGNMAPQQAVRILIEDFEEDETPLQEEIEEKILARVCKRAAIKAGQVLSGEEQRKLVQDLENCVSPRTCPHGRPTMIHLSIDLVERQFGRKGPR